jgi:hypothetical protein
MLLNNAQLAKFLLQVLNRLFMLYVFNTILKISLKDTNTNTTLCGGSLGSRIDEERSKLRELM